MSGSSRSGVRNKTSRVLKLWRHLSTEAIAREGDWRERRMTGSQGLCGLKKGPQSHRKGVGGGDNSAPQNRVSPRSRDGAAPARSVVRWCQFPTLPPCWGGGVRGLGCLRRPQTRVLGTPAPATLRPFLSCLPLGRALSAWLPRCGVVPFC
jgi:hypothetical protein